MHAKNYTKCDLYILYPDQFNMHLNENCQFSRDQPKEFLLHTVNLSRRVDYHKIAKCFLKINGG